MSSAKLEPQGKKRVVDARIEKLPTRWQIDLAQRLWKKAMIIF